MPRRNRYANLQKADLDHLVKHEEPIYLINTSGREAVTLIIFNNPADGKAISHEVPYQRVPWKINDYFSYNLIGQSTDLRTHLAKGTLSVLDPDFAETMLSDPRVAKQVDRLKTAMTKKKNNQNTTNGVRPTRDIMAVHPRVESIVARLTAGSGSDEDQRAAIQDLELALSEIDEPEFAYILQHCTGLTLISEWTHREMSSDIEGMMGNAKGEAAPVEVLSASGDRRMGSRKRMEREVERPAFVRSRDRRAATAEAVPKPRKRRKKDAKPQNTGLHVTDQERAKLQQMMDDL